jgi:hypothetical protein
MNEKMSRRDNFAVLILTGLLAHSGLQSKNQSTEWAMIAVEQADELIRYLDAVEVAENYNHHTAWAFGGSEHDAL